MLIDSVSGKGPLPGLQIVAFSLHPHMAFSWCVHKERERSHVSFSFYKHTNLIMKAPPSWPHLTLITSPKLHLQILSHWMVGLNIWCITGHLNVNLCIFRKVQKIKFDIQTSICLQGFPDAHGGKEPVCHCRRHKRCGFDPWVGNIPWRGAWQPTSVFLPGESHGQRGAWLAQFIGSQIVGHNWSSLAQQRCIYFSQSFN